MGAKGEKTRQGIREKACQLFAQKGYKDVTMKDICEVTGLSRGGLYRHYESTEQIFLEIVNAFSERQREEVFTKIGQQVPALSILEELLARYEEEMLDSKTSLSLAICEFFSDPEIPKEDNAVTRQYEMAKATWAELIRYGIGTNAFRQVDPEAVFHVFVFSYQGMRMYSRLMKLDRGIPRQITGEIKRLLLKNGG